MEGVFSWIKNVIFQNKPFLMLASKKSKSVTQSRMDKMRVANRGVMKILLETQLQVLKEITKNESQYAQLLTKLIV